VSKQAFGNYYLLCLSAFLLAAAGWGLPVAGVQPTRSAPEYTLKE
jgi:hypothetical protein